MITLQNFLTPEFGICTETALYHQEHGSIGVSYDAGSYVLPRSSRLGFDSYFNMLDLSRWSAACTLDGLFLEFTGAGEVEVQIIHARPGRSDETVFRDVVTWTQGSPHVVDLSAFATGATGALYVRLTALGDRVTLNAARFATRSLPAPLPALTVSITTFKREAEVQATVARLEAFLKTFAYGDQIRVQVVDNGQSAEIAKTDHVTPYPNRNLGGAGGFARGLLEAEASGASHCLFMDDDASFHMENIARAYMFLALACDPKTAVAGAMINNTLKWSMWENGAWFNGSCHPIANATNLRRPKAVLKMLFESASPRPETFYGGWWFFAFPLAAVTHHPFPFFVRGDDISFSLANDFNIQTLNGVVSFQDDFTEKESAQTLYLDIRNHIIHHLVFDSLARSPLGTAKVPLRFILRSLLRMHYSTAEAQLLAWRDVMSGPEFFDTHIDMSTRRADLKELAADEAWCPIDQQPYGERHGRLTRISRSLRTKLGLLTLNGHIVPFWSRLASHVKIEIKHRSLVYYSLGTARVTYFNTNRDNAYTVTHNKKRFYAIALETVKTAWAFYREYDQIKAAYRKGYAEMTRKSYWEKTLELPSPDPAKTEDTAENKAGNETGDTTTGLQKQAS